MSFIDSLPSLAGPLLKAVFRPWGIDVDERLANLEAGVAGLSAGHAGGYATLADLTADLVPADQTLARVTNDPDPANNGTWRKSGATGTGTWVQAAAMPEELALGKRVEWYASLGDLEMAAAPTQDGALASASGYALPRDGGGGLFQWDVTSLDDELDGFVILPNGQSELVAGRWLRVPPTEVTVQMAGAVGANALETARHEAAARWAFDNNIPLFHPGSYAIALKLDPTAEAAADTDAARGDVVKAANRWVAGCKVTGAREVLFEHHGGNIAVEIDGTHFVEGPMFRERHNAPLYLRSSGVTFRKLAASGGLTYGPALPNDNFEVTCTLDAAAADLPAHFVIGFPFGLRNISSDTPNDDHAEEASGGGIVSWVAGDLRSFKFLMKNTKHATLISPTTLDIRTHPEAADSRSLNRSEVVIPNGALVATGGWDGTQAEGFINLYGGFLHLKHIAIGYEPDDATSRDLIYGAGLGSGLYCEDDVVLVGAGGAGKVIRGIKGFKADLNFTCASIGARAQALISLQSPHCMVETTRTCLQGHEQSALASGAGTAVNLRQSIITCGEEGVRLDEMAQGSADTTKFVGMELVAQVLCGTMYFDKNTELRRCTDDFGFQALGFVRSQAATWPTRTDIDNETIGNVGINGGGWFRDPLTGLVRDDGVVVSMANNKVYEAELTGIGGRIEIVCETINDVGLIADVDLASQATYLVPVYTSADVEIGPDDTETLAGENPGKITISVRDVAGTKYLRVLHENGSSRVIRAYGKAVSIGSFADVTPT